MTKTSDPDQKGIHSLGGTADAKNNPKKRPGKTDKSRHKRPVVFLGDFVTGS